jgi:hypothetical protein
MLTRPWTILTLLVVYVASLLSIGQGQASASIMPVNGSSPTLPSKSVVAIDSLVGEYLFNEATGNVIIDSSGQGRNGTVSGAQWVARQLVDNNGQAGYALKFSNGAYASVPSDALKYLPLSISVWVNPQANVNDIRNNIISNDLPAHAGHGIGINSSGNVYLEYEGIGWFRNTSYQVQWGNWYHIVAIYETGRIRTYLNGNLVDDFSHQQEALDAQLTFLIGRHNFDTSLGDGVFYNGLVDSLRIYHKALSEEEIWSLYQPTLDCSDSQAYFGIRHCTDKEKQIFYIDPKNLHVRFETVLAMGKSRDGISGECKDVNRPFYSWGPGCIAPNGTYPAQRVGDMASRYPGATLAFNGDLFGSRGFTHGPEGLTVKNGARFDGVAMGDCDSRYPPPQDTNGRCDPPGNDVNRPSIAFSRTGGQVNISRKRIEDLENPALYADRFYNAIGGFPILVENRVSVVDHECQVYPSTCSDMSGSIKRARTAIGKRENGELIVMVFPQAPGLTLSELAAKMIDLGAVEAINLDGGTSSQLWYAGATSSDKYLVKPNGPVAEGVFVFSNPGTTYTISGQVKDTNNAAVQGVSISVGSISTTTDGNGNYTLNGVEPGMYMVTPSKADYSFSPSSSQVSVPPNVIGKNFTGSLTCPAIAALGSSSTSQTSAILAAADLITLYRRFRNEVLSTTAVGQGYIKTYNQHGLELSAILLTHSDLRSRTTQFLEHAAPTFESLLPNSTSQTVLTQGLYDEAASLVNDLTNAGSPKLREDIRQTWEDLSLDEHIGESPMTIWREIQSFVYLPLVVR